MKNTYSVLFIMLMFLGIGCQKNDTNLGNLPSGPASPVLPTYPPGAPPGQGQGSVGDNWDYGGTTEFTPTNFQTLSTYAAQGPLNNPSGFKINVNLVNQGGGKYAGHFKLAYIDSGNLHESYQETGSGQIDKHSASQYHGKYDFEFNQWFTWKGKEAFHAFFQDSIGAIVLVIDDVFDLGDGGGSSTVSGKVYFKNFQIARTGQSESKCWFIYKTDGIDPKYGCGTFYKGGFIDTTSALYPGDGYILLGTFTNLDRAKAFNQ